MHHPIQSHLAKLSLALLLLFAVGCKQSMSIAVERLDVNPQDATGHADVPELRVYLTGTIAHQVALSHSAIERTTEQLAAYERARDESAFGALNLAENVQEQLDEREATYPDLELALTECIAVEDQILEVARHSSHYFHASPTEQSVMLAELTSTITRARIYLAEVEALIDAVMEVNQNNLAVLNTAIREAQKRAMEDPLASTQFDELKKLRDTLGGIPNATAALRQAQRVASAGRQRFGGYASETVHTISPGDPAYSAVLDAPVVGKPISMVSSTAWGDSTIMFVQESPTQMRVFTVDVDGTQLAQNIMLITDKALQAAVNHLSPLPLGGGSPPAGD